MESIERAAKIAELLLAKLDHALRGWTTSGRNSSCVTIEDVYTELVCWKIHHQGEAYCKAGLEEVIEMQRSWMTAAGHFKEPEIQQEYDYCHLINWNNVDDIESLFYQILKILILSEDADAAYIALTGLFALLRSDAKYLKNIEDDWEEYHYRAKEWLMMLYELLWYWIMEVGIRYMRL